MKPISQPSGLHAGLTFLIAADWTPEQALAVFELVNDLRERIWQQYAPQIQNQMQEQRCIAELVHRSPTDNPPF